MTRQELLNKINRATSLKVHDILDPRMVLGGIDGAEFFKDMNSFFLDDIQKMTGNKYGIEKTENAFRFIITGAHNSRTDPVVSFVLNFNRYSGLCTGITDIIYKQDIGAVEAIEIASKEEVRDAVPQLKGSITKFIGYGRQLKYLIEAND